MRGRLRSVGFAIASLTFGATAQAPVPAPQQPQQPEPQEQEPAPAEKPAAEPPEKPPDPQPQPQPIDETKAAAELLRKRLGLDQGPQGEPPPGPKAAQEPAPQEPPKLPQGPPEAPPAGQPVDESDAAGKALERLLPGTVPPATAPIADEAGTPESVPASRLEALEVQPTGLQWNGMLSSLYRARHGAGASDQDLLARLTLDVGNDGSDALTAHVSARGYADLDGRPSNDPYAGLDDSRGNDVEGYLYLAHVDAHHLPHVDLARLGRQDLDETPAFVTFDGLRVDSEEFGDLRVWASAYGGVPVHFFESSAHGDSVVGGTVGMSPWRDARVRFDYMDLHDEYVAIDHHDSLTGVRWWQRIDSVHLMGVYTWRDGSPRDLHIGARTLDTPVRLSVDYRGLLSTQRAGVTEVDPFHEIALDYAPYREVDASLGFDLGEQVLFDVGADVRRLESRADEGAFNREFERYRADFTVLDVFTRGLSVTISGSIWDSTGEEFETIAGDIEYRPDRSMRLTLGSSYDLFRYDVFTATEHLDVRSFYLRAERRIGDTLWVDGGYEYQRDDIDEFHVFRLEVTWTL
jgi:hypothetical protein